MKILFHLIVVLFMLVSCGGNQAERSNGAFKKTDGASAVHYDFDRIQTTGELIVATLSGPDSYFEYQGQPMGLQYALASHFAQKNGLRLRVELAHDKEQLIKMLISEEADIICYPMEDSLLKSKALVAAGVYTGKSKELSWAVRNDAPLLAEALDAWYGRGIVVSVEKEVNSQLHTKVKVKRKVRAPYLSKDRGIISEYDEYFKSAARVIGWDWRLIAAQCYQESGFDPQAISWAGARGLMQIMPSTAEHLCLSRQLIHEPKENIAAAARYLQELIGKFSDIGHPVERIKFVLASYNGGPGHVRDAMALARKDGENWKEWSTVGPYILRLSEPQYYRDPIVKHGYMIGSETYDYVISVWERWRAYGGVAAALSSMPQHTNAKGEIPVLKKNRFTKGTKIYRPDDPEFNQLNKE